jgi:hypothetical protein
MSVLHMAVRKDKSCTQSIPNKERLLFFTGELAFSRALE